MFKRTLFSGLCALLLALFARLPLGTDPEHGVIRLSWRHVGASIAQRLSDEDLAALPAHMRPPDQVAQVQAVDYQLEVSVDGDSVLSQTVRPGGLKRDRPLFVFESLPVAPGDHQLEISFQADSSEVEEEPFTLSQSVSVEAGEVVLVGLKEDAREPRLTIQPRDR